MPVSLIPSFLFYCFVSGVSMKYGKKDALRQWKGLFAGYAVVSIASVFIAY